MNTPDIKKKETIYTIYQAKNSRDGFNILFSSYNLCKKLGFDISFKNYEEVYQGVFPEGESLDYLYTKFNLDHPEDFHGHSLSVSDVIVLSEKGNEPREGKAFFVDSIGFKEISEFFLDSRTVYLKNAKAEIKADGSCCCIPFVYQDAGNDIKPLKGNIQDLKKGDFFMVSGIVCEAAFDSHQNFDEPDNPWIVYDADGNGWFSEDIDNFFTLGEDIDWITDHEKRIFILDDELCVQDKYHECVDGYLWATDFLVDRLKECLLDYLSSDMFKTLDNINFYPIWNQRTGDIEILSCYCVGGKRGEVRKEMYIDLHDEEKAVLSALMDNYCISQYGKSCFEFCNKEREDQGLAKLKDPNLFLAKDKAGEITLPLVLEKLPDKEKVTSLADMLADAKKRENLASEPVKSSHLGR